MGVIPPIILANTALGETIAALRRLDVANSDGANRSLKNEIHAIDLSFSERATVCLRTACVAGNLTMVVSDPHTGSRHPVPAEYFDRSNADIEFSRVFFLDAYELSEQVVADTFYKLAHPYRGWVHGFIEPEFRAWLENPENGATNRLANTACRG